jgi:ribosome recycling factor
MSDEMVDLVLDDVEEKMAKAVVHAREEFSTVRTGRAAPALLEKVQVEYHGTDVSLQQIAGISVPEARQLLISPYDQNDIGAIEKAIQNSDLGLTPSNDGKSIRLTFPPLTEERRRDLVKLVKGMGEDGKVAIRNLRRAARKELEAFAKDGDISKDDVEVAEKRLDGLTHAHEAEIDGALQHKEQELLEV